MKRITLLTALSLLAATARAATNNIMLVPHGSVDVRSDPKGDWKAVTAPSPLQPGDEVRAGKEATADILFSDGSKVILSPESQFAVEKADAKEASLKLNLGKLRAYFSGIFSSRLSVRTPVAVCSVRGTEFELSAEPGKTEAHVAEGHLEISDNHGHQAVVTSEEAIKVNTEGMEAPHVVSLTDSRAQGAARPASVQREMAFDRARSMIEELRNRELKSNEAQLGKDAIDAFGNRVRIEEYALRPALNQFEFLFLSIRENRFDHGHLLETFNGTLPNDFSAILGIVNNTFLSKTLPGNYLTGFEFFATNTIDSIKETITLGAPVAVNFTGYGAAIGTRFYPSTIDFNQFLSGPGVPGGTRQQFAQHQDFGVTSAGLFTWTQSIVNNLGVLTLLDKFQLNPAIAADAAPPSPGLPGCNLVGEVCFDNSGQLQFAGLKDITSFPSGTSKADLLVTTTYPDGSTLSSEKIFVDNKGKIFDFSNPTKTTFNANGNYNLEIVVGSSLFQGRNIDVLIAPEILAQKKQNTTTPDVLVPQ